MSKADTTLATLAIAALVLNVLGLIDSLMGEPDTYRAIVELPTGASSIIEHDASLSDCMAVLAEIDDSKYSVTYCEKE
ncbi:hypothetical protein [uncultured Sulfitobacter sp.]|uniref:hypothetical protein n=1 Tax=uncultured Sulfitobacter sp. TaxID=191468 RepID=UPI00259A1232|nr:hypothetical protein [uncultured Sulfitobacter sp.]